MAEYIDREALEARLNERYDYLCKENGSYDHYTDGYKEAVSAVEDFPSAADVAPVVRCKDCAHSWEDLSGLCCSHGICVDCTVPEDFFCAFGKRRDSDDGSTSM